MSRLSRRGLLAALGSALLLAACGKKADPEPPPGRGAEFTYPLRYPDPALVAPPLPDAAAREEPRRTGPSVFSRDRSRTRTYGPATSP